MLQLGYNKYGNRQSPNVSTIQANKFPVTQGGDWGFSITRLVGANYPTHCLASHVNVAQIGPERLAEFLSSNPSLTPEESAGIERTNWFFDQGSGYNALQQTKPSTIGFALRDSPVALLSWIYEKLHDWTDSYSWTDNEILTWISIYQFSRAGPDAACRIYYEATHTNVEEETAKIYGHNGKVKLGITYFPKDLSVPPNAYGRTLGDVVFEKRRTSGGHFAAHERPEWLVEDLKGMFGENGGANDVSKKVLA